MDNWRLTPLTNISAASDCAVLGADYFALTIPSYPGVDRYCDCGTLELSTRGVCNSTQIGCTNVSQSLPQVLKWRNVTLCGRRIGGDKSAGSNGLPLNALNRPRVVGAASCPSGFRKCGVYGGPADDTKEFTCSLANDSCPITSVRVVSNAQIGSDPGECQGPNTFGLDRSICVSREQTALPAVTSRVFPDSACFPGRLELRPRTQFDFRTGPEEYCAKSDPRWGTRETRSETALYADIGISVPYINFSNPSRNFAFADRNEILWQFNCTFERMFVVDLDDDVQSLTSAQLALLVISILLGVSIGIGYNCWECNQKDDESYADDTKRQLCCRRCKMCVIIGGSLGKIVPLAVALAISISVRSTFADLKDAACSDPDFQNTISFFATESRKQSFLNIALLVGVIVDIVLEGWGCFKSFRDRSSGGKVLAA